MSSVEEKESAAQRYAAFHSHREPHLREDSPILPRFPGATIRDSLEASMALPGITTDPLSEGFNVNGLPTGISLGSNGHLPVEELVNAEALIIIKTVPSPTEVTKSILTEPALIRETTKRFVERSGALTRVRDRHYSAEAKANWTRRRAGLLSGEIRPYVRERFVPSPEDLGEDFYLVTGHGQNPLLDSGEYIPATNAELEGLKQYETEMSNLMLKA